jgi:hypothetical protein
MIDLEKHGQHRREYGELRSTVPRNVTKARIMLFSLLVASLAKHPAYPRYKAISLTPT